MPARSAIRCVLAATFAVAAGLRPIPGLSFGSSTLRPLAAAAAPPRRRLRSPPPQLLDPLDWLADQLEVRLRARREGKLRRPKRIILVRHGQSEGNVNRTAYQSTPDSQIALTEVGWAQGVVAGLQIRELVKNESIRCFYSPYLRARQTLLALLQVTPPTAYHASHTPHLSPPSPLSPLSPSHLFHLCRRHLTGLRLADCPALLRAAAARAGKTVPRLLRERPRLPRETASRRLLA